MNKILIYTLLSLSLFSACKKDNGALVNNIGTDQALLKELTAQSEELTQSEFGWKAYLYPSGGAGYSFYMNFDTAGKVIMYADLDFNPSVISMESSYQVKTSDIPSLLFEDSGYLNILANPNPKTFGGVASWGLYQDFEFNFNKQSGDTLILNGKLLDSQLILIKATQAEQDSYNSKGLYTSVLSSVNYINNNPNLYIKLGDETKIKTTFNYLNKVFSFTWEENGILNNYSSAFVFTLTGVLLQKPLTYKNKGVSEFTWDAVKEVFFVMINGTRIETTSSDTPVLPLHSLIGISYSTVIVPYMTSYPGWSEDFQNRRATAASATLTNSYRLRLDRMIFAFNRVSNVMTITADVYQGTVKYLANFPYKYTMTEAGVYKFTAGTTSGNAALIATDMAVLTDRIGADNFILDYFIHPESGQLLGQFKSVEHPDFYFTGSLQ